MKIHGNTYPWQTEAPRTLLLGIIPRTLTHLSARLTKASMIESARDHVAPERPTMKMTEPKSHFPVRPAPKRKPKRKRRQPAPDPQPEPLPEKKEPSNG